VPQVDIELRLHVGDLAPAACDDDLVPELLLELFRRHILGPVERRDELGAAGTRTRHSA